MTNTASRAARSLTARATACGWIRSLLRAGSDCLSSISSQRLAPGGDDIEELAVALRFHPTEQRFDCRLHRADDAEFSRRAAAEHARPLVDLDDDALGRQEHGIRIVGAEHQKQIAMHDGVIDRLRSDHADAAHPARVVVRHDVFALDGMDQWRLEPIGERTQFLGCAMTSGAAHDHDAAGLVDTASDLGDIGFAGDDFRSRLERRDARNAAVGLGADDVHRQRQMRDAAAGIGGGDRLMDDSRRLCRRGNGLGIERDITEQHVCICRLKIVRALQLDAASVRRAQEPARGRDLPHRGRRRDGCCRARLFRNRPQAGP